MNQIKSWKVDIQQQNRNLTILEMPRDYRKNFTSQQIRNGEISIEKIEAPMPKKKDMDQQLLREYSQYQRKKNILLIKDEREGQTYQTQKFIDELPQSQSLLLFKQKDRFMLSFINNKSEVYKYLTEAEQALKFKDIDKGLDARKNQENRDRVDMRIKKQIITSVPQYEENLSSSDQFSESSQKKQKRNKKLNKKQQHKLDDSDDGEKAKKKVKINESSDDEVSSDSVMSSFSS